MAKIELVDVSLRDGNQSLWGATGVTNRMVAGVAGAMDQVGYRAMELLSSTAMAVAVRFHQEDPWERIRLAKAAAPTTPLGFLTGGKRFITFYRTPDVLFKLAFELLARNGVTRMWVVDPMLDMQGANRIATLARESGFTDIVGGVCFTISPVHSDEYYAAKIVEFDDCAAIDSIYIKDPAGLLTPDRLRSLAPLLQAQLKTKRLNEIHSHTTTGISPQTMLTAADHGFTVIHSALPPLANGNSHPSGPHLVRNLRARGHEVDVDVEAMLRASAYLTRQAKIKGLPAGVPAEYDENYYRHTLAGGLRSTLARQLREIGRPELEDAVVEESIRVREDLGWPIVMTPFAQYIVTQATLNIISGERYKQIADEVVDLVRGDFGPVPGTVNPDLFDRVMNTRRGRLPADDGTSELTIADLRARFGTAISDEELLLRAVMPQGQVDAMAAARGRSGASLLKSALRASARTPVSYFSVGDGTTRITLTREPTDGREQA